ncbi:unnamed protein product [Microthlaspi erraticum]|uniref:Uncharacterized protein n=1 Tax=Microthlaspi erraticum TaxID=1685480 RepID=A0A6D2JD76_9BRAS|nr:unnamed protein product [Microthlaspi erraticum]
MSHLKPSDICFMENVIATLKSVLVRGAAASAFSISRGGLFAAAIWLMGSSSFLALTGLRLFVVQSVGGGVKLISELWLTLSKIYSQFQQRRQLLN